ncbi:MAG: prolipoprotein diacylglyceryl transferase [Chloroflexi bacterium]|nr:prolipoprotein diacylglyceryl transferase [Chloroflexota bacterium]
MTAITIGFDPLIRDIGSSSIGWHGLLMLLGIVVATWLTVRLAVKNGIPAHFVYTTTFWIIAGGLIGARLVHVLDNLDFYGKEPGEVLAFWNGGLSWYGGLLGGLLAGVICARLSKVSLGRFADAAAPGVILGLAIGRIGCTINGDAYGTPTSLPWGLVYTNPNAQAPLFVAGHPAPVYEIIWDLIIFGVLWRLRGRLKPEGSLFLTMIAMYSFGRFLISWVREEPSVLGPLHQAHIISLVLFVGAVALLTRWRVASVKPVPAAEDSFASQPPEIDLQKGPAQITGQGQNQEG